MKKVSAFWMIIGMAVMQLSHAFPAVSDNMLQLTIKNNTTEVLHYMGASHTNPGSIFIINMIDIFPGGQAVVTCMSSPYYDLAGELHFNDAAGNGNLLTVLDRRLIHYGQPIFSMSNNQFISFVESKVFNSAGSDNPRALSYIAAKVIIEKNPAPHAEPGK